MIWMTDSDSTGAHQRRQHWDNVYTSKAPNQLSWYQPVPATSLSLILAANLNPAAKIIDIGGGVSTLADNLLAQGYRSITVLDLASVALDQSKQRLGPAAKQINWLVADITTWQPHARYDLWHDRAVFHFLTDPGDRRAYFTALKNALQPGATVILATFALDGPERCSGLSVQRYSPETLAEELGSEFTLLETAPEDHHTPSGTIQRFVYCRFTH